MEATIRHLNATIPNLLPGYRVKIIDGNAIAASEHRLEELRQITALPGVMKNKPHVSTAKILAQRIQKINTP